ncbi:hypothetical protein BJ875DRAFT_453577 [Amylocarpus encephaloides]|uniref:Uncharacterized protein n=1 Tax=Amylocarpus encephaloides TaxID=45428 RepID=A0A9P7YPA1_9HELO|nr:hypothetical protein BJ875DRAFT_453577 [Amylocarpus encephaloides]
MGGKKTPTKKTPSKGRPRDKQKEAEWQAGSRACEHFRRDPAHMALQYATRKAIEKPTRDAAISRHRYKAPRKGGRRGPAKARTTTTKATKATDKGGEKKSGEDGENDDDEEEEEEDEDGGLFLGDDEEKRDDEENGGGGIFGADFAGRLVSV